MDVEKTMQFLLESQARFDARQVEAEVRLARIEKILQDVALAQENTNAILVTLVERHVALAESHASLSQAVVETREELARSLAETREELARSEARTREELARSLAESHATLSQALAESHEALSRAQRETEQSLKALIAKVDGHITSHQ